MATFYDSLDEADSIGTNSPNSDDYSKVVPLYRGEVPKIAVVTKTTNKTNKPSIKKKQILINPPTFISEKPKKTYVTIYHERLNRLKGTSFNNGNITGSSGAVCDILSPRRHSDLELVSSTPLHSDGSQSDYDKEFYDNFNKLQLNEQKKSSQSKSKQCQITSSDEKRKNCPPLTKIKPSERPFYFNSSAEYHSHKLELLKRRQTYGMKVSIRNRIQMEEEKSLKKINEN